MRRTILLVVAVFALASCATGPHGPWLDAADRLAEGINEYPSQFVCQEQGVTFFDFGGHRFAADPNELLGQLTNEAGEPTPFMRTDRSLDTLFAVGVTHTHAAPGFDPVTRTLYVDLDKDLEYIYIHVDDPIHGQYLEAWPRANEGCPPSTE